jgi:hypothetical protein
MRNRLLNPHETIDENLTECLEKHVILGYERKRKYLISNTYGIVLQTISRNIILIALTGGEKLAEQSRRTSIDPTRRHFVTGITSPWSNIIFRGGCIDVETMNLMKIMGDPLISLIAVNSVGEPSSHTIQSPWGEARRSSILSTCKCR